MDDADGSAFVGRHRELELLDSMLTRATDGATTVALVSGEPGIGKSGLVDEFATRARTRDARVLWGRCWEAGGAPAYWPWTQALRATMRDPSAADRVGALGAGASYLAQLLPELPAADPPASSGTPDAPDPETARFRLFDAVATYVDLVARDGPLVVVLEDVHGADTPTLLLLQFLARELVGAPLLLLVTYRTTELGPTHPLRAILAELARLPGTRRITLTGLAPDEIAELVQRVTGAAPDPSLVDELRERTEGNPLFVGEVVRLMGPHELGAGRALPDVVPDGVHEAITQRLDGLPVECRDLLAVASVLGRELRLETLARTAGRDLADAFDALDPAVGAGLVERGSVPAAVRFSHALVRDVVYDTLPLATRAQLHVRAAEVLEERYGHELDEHASEVAHHYLAAGPTADIGRAVRAATFAGRVATRLLAHEEAARLLRAAHELAELHGLDEGRIDRLLDLGDAEMRAGELAAARGHLRLAATLAEEAHSVDALARAAVAYGGRFAWERAGNDRELVPLLVRALDAIGSEDSPLRVRLLARLAGARRDEPDQEPRRAAGREAVDMARRLDDVTTLAYALNGMHGSIWEPDNPHERLALAEEAIAVANETGDAEEEIMARAARCWAMWELGDYAGARAEHVAAATLVARLRQPAQRWLHASVAAALALFDGRFDEVEGLAERAREEGTGSLRSDAEAAHLAQVTMLRLERGRAHELLRDLDAAAVAYPWYPHFRALAARVRATEGDPGGARRELESLLVDDLRAIPPNNYTLYSYALLADAAAELRARDLAAPLLRHVEPYAERVAVAPPEGAFGVLARPLGRLLALADRPDDAVAHLERALAAHERMGTRPWLAHTAADLADVLEARAAPGEDAAATQLRSRAAAIAADLGMTALHERVGVSGAATVAVAPDVDAVVVANRFRRDGEVWAICFEGRAFRLRDSKGLQYLAELLRRPHHDVPAVELVGAIDDGRQPVLDDAARRAYRQRVEELQDDIDEADRFHDDERAARARAELDALVAELTAAAGLGGRTRAMAGEGERARQRVRKAIAAALDRLEAHDAALGRHLVSTVRTGYLCRYEPDPRAPIPWDV